MNGKAESVFESLTSLACAISEDTRLTQWLLGLEKKPAHERVSEIQSMTAKMAASRDAQNFAKFFRLLTVPEIFRAVCHSVRNCSLSSK